MIVRSNFRCFATRDTPEIRTLGPSSQLRPYHTRSQTSGCSGLLWSLLFLWGSVSQSEMLLTDVQLITITPTYFNNSPSIWFYFTGCFQREREPTNPTTMYWRCFSIISGDIYQYPNPDSGISNVVTTFACLSVLFFTSSLPSTSESSDIQFLPWNYRTLYLHIILQVTRDNKRITQFILQFSWHHTHRNGSHFSPLNVIRSPRTHSWGRLTWEALCHVAGQIRR